MDGEAWRAVVHGVAKSWVLRFMGSQRIGCCGSWGRKEPDTTERLHCTELMSFITFLKIQFI